MQNDAPWVNDAFDDFNTLPEDIIELVIESTENYIWESTGEVLADFGSWMNNASRSSMNSDWPIILKKMMKIHPQIHQTTKLSLKNYTQCRQHNMILTSWKLE